jgi:hypothetical protein
MDPDHKQILESRIKKSKTAKSTLSLLLDKYEAEVTPRKKSSKSELSSPRVSADSGFEAGFVVRQP